MAHPDSNAPHVRFINVQKTYDGETLIVKNLNLDVRRGEFLTLLGPSGSGKTTSLMMLAGFETVTDGDIFVGDQRTSAGSATQRGMGMVFRYALFPAYERGRKPRVSPASSQTRQQRSAA